MQKPTSCWYLLILGIKLLLQKFEANLAISNPCYLELTTTSRMEVGCCEARAIYPWLAIPKYQPRDPTQGVVWHPSHWITVEKDRCQEKKKKKVNPAGLKGHTMRWRSQEKGEGQQKQQSHSSRWKGQWEHLGHNRTSMGWLSLESAMGITLHTKSTHPWGNTNTQSAHPWAGSRLRVPWDNADQRNHSSEGQLSHESAAG